MKISHSEPVLYIFLILNVICFLIEILIFGFLGIPIVFLSYLFVGFLIWMITGGTSNFILMILLWFPAVLFDKPEMTSNN